jgi:small redox-active disulfide protein 2
MLVKFLEFLRAYHWVGWISNRLFDILIKKVREWISMIIKILGSGCKNCETLKANTEKTLKETGVVAEIIKVDDLKEVMAYGVMSTPALVIDEKVVSVGKVLKPKDIAKILETYK